LRKILFLHKKLFILIPISIIYHTQQQIQLQINPDLSIEQYSRSDISHAHVYVQSQALAKPNIKPQLQIENVTKNTPIDISPSGSKSKFENDSVDVLSGLSITKKKPAILKAPKSGFFSTGTFGEKLRLPADPLETETLVINLGLIGTGSSLLGGYFHHGGFSTSHSQCLRNWVLDAFPCGSCIDSKIATGSLPLEGCGKYSFWSQLGYLKYEATSSIPKVILPQVDHLATIVNAYPEATFVLTVRSSGKVWADNVMNHFILKDAFKVSAIEGLSFKKEEPVERQLAVFHDSHMNRVINFLGKRVLVIDFGSPDADTKAQSHFGISRQFWGIDMHGHLVKRNESYGRKFSISSGGIRAPPPLPVDGSTPWMKLPSPVIAVGFPKTGTTSLFGYFHCGGIPSSHYRCSRFRGNFRCGDCVRHNIVMGRPMFQSCGKFDVWAEINVSDKSDEVIFLPQVENLYLIHKDYPNATLVLTKRDPDAWVKSVRHWHHLHRFFINTEISGLPAGAGKNYEELRSFFVEHTKRLRRFVHDHPSHTLVEVDIDKEDAGEVLQDAFGIDKKCWGKSNVGNYDEKSSKI